MRRLLAVALLLPIVPTLFAADAVPEDTPKAAATRKLLQKKVSMNWKDTAFNEVIEDLKLEVKGLGVRVDTKSGVNLNKQITYSCKDIPLEDMLTELLGKNGWGFYVKSQKNDGYDGVLHIRVGKERGWEGKEGKPSDKKDK